MDFAAPDALQIGMCCVRCEDKMQGKMKKKQRECARIVGCNQSGSNWSDK